MFLSQIQWWLRSACPTSATGNLRAMGPSTSSLLFIFGYHHGESWPVPKSYGADLVNKFYHSITILRWNKALWLDAASRVISFNQLECFISKYTTSYVTRNLILLFLTSTAVQFWDFWKNITWYCGSPSKLNSLQ